MYVTSVVTVKAKPSARRQFSGGAGERGQFVARSRLLGTFRGKFLTQLDVINEPHV